MTLPIRRLLQALLVTLLVGSVVLVMLERGGADATSQALATTTGDAAVDDDGVVVVVVPVDPIDAMVARISSNPAAGGLSDTGIRVILSRDPFRLVVPDPEASGGAPSSPADPATPSGPADPADPANPSDPADPSSPSGSSDACSGDAAETVCEGTVVTLVGITAGSASIAVDGTTYEVAQGATFAQSFRVLAVDSSCVTLQYGDESFSLCVGASVLK